MPPPGNLFLRYFFMPSDPVPSQSLGAGSDQSNLTQSLGKTQAQALPVLFGLVLFY